jgi:hypothetical protein
MIQFSSTQKARKGSMAWKVLSFFIRSQSQELSLHSHSLKVIGNEPDASTVWMVSGHPSTRMASGSSLLGTIICSLVAHF